MRICIDSNYFAVLIDQASGTIQDQKGSAIEFVRERLLHFIKENKAEVILPSPVYSELLMISTVTTELLDKYLGNNGRFIICPYDVRAARVHAEVEKPILRKDKRAGRNETMARLKFDRQILSIAKQNGVELIVTSDTGVISDSKRYDINTICVAEMDLPPSIRQPGLDLDQGEVDYPVH